ncbi:6-hydroxymethylpterin diphosphokinase MptE-like protein [Helicobacter mustelae]|uniref:Motility accessory factor n=1 Tax=Helicobacter mustelae (strain ATCC 43772 / CCUG 25715 / CIP 103759 / LMG 18044 / NCTC 12198 / R85-136P) TaxID=679897 RepID=D3UHS1_HELM1|nr:6-hydroxymethylpterin diphosphokinase MptE-like protein [Helicobacter mustelae]CBG40044.1 Putative hypothetical protein [Helicobacter mustelae 12198]SQH71558.1 Uncharacterized protein conserved in bacteria [Helicobacter mustelae]STP12683.1 Uncharacterized protein conserved in bacteria [Helicobacter mustelae]
MTLQEILTEGDTQKIQNLLSQRMVKNMEFFAIHSPKLFTQLKKPPTDYNLLFDKKGLNIIDLRTKSLLYPTLEGQYTMVETHGELSLSPSKNPRWKLHHNEVSLSPIDEKKFPITGEAIASFIKLLQKHQGIKEYYLDPKFMPTTLLYGLLGGLFLEFMRERGVFFHALFIFEENLDLFRISCYFLDYEALFESTNPNALYLFVQNIFDKKMIRNFFAARKITSNFLLCELQCYQSKKMQQISSFVMQEFSANKRGWGSFEDEMKGLENTLQNYSMPTLSFPKRQNIPICVVGNGPSLDALLPFIAQNQEKMLIFSCGTALKPLKNAGICVDFQIEIERIDYLSDVLRAAPLGDTTLLCGNMVSPAALHQAREAYVFLRGGSACSYLDKNSVMEFCAPFVGNAGASLAMQLGSEILLCGLDCGYIEGESKHASNSYYGKEKSQIPSHAIEVKGNANKRVFADSIFLLSLQNLADAIDFLKPRLVLNLGFGAYVEGARSIHAEGISLRPIDKQAAISQIKSYMKKNPPLDFRAKITNAYAFRDCMLELLGRGARSKKELFCLMDELLLLLSQTSRKDPHLGILFEGTLAHVAQSLLLSAMHLPHDDIFVFFAQCLEVIARIFDKMLLQYKLLLGLYANTHKT